jgi:hypothetical protein
MNHSDPEAYNNARRMKVTSRNTPLISRASRFISSSVISRTKHDRINFFIFAFSICASSQPPAIPFGADDHRLLLLPTRRPPNQTTEPERQRTFADSRILTPSASPRSPSEVLARHKCSMIS